MTVIVKHNKTNTITDWTQAQLDEQIALGNFAPGTTLANIVLPSDWNNDHTLTGVGTMAEQDATAVAITGGTINNTTIGATTASTGVFTTLTVNNTTGTSLANIWSNTNTSPIADLQFTRGTTSTWGGDAFTDYKLRASGGNFVVQSQNNATSVLDLLTFDEANNAVKFSPGGIEQARVSRTASAVNYVQVTGAATTAAPTISAQGSDGNIFMQFNSKGTSGFNFYSGGGSFRQLRIDGANSSVNFLGIAGSVANQVPILNVAAASSDTNVSLAIQPKGTGAIDLAAGSSGVNISNGNTVTAITRTNTGSGYTTIPSVAVSAPTTAGGVTATATANMFVFSVTVANGGTGYTVGNVLTLVGGTGSAGQVTVATVSGGVITGITNGPSNGLYSALPTTPAATTGGSGSGATINITGYGVSNFTITNAGSGYIEQPTITFSGGGGSGAAAFASVGSTSTFRSLGQNFDFATPNGTGLRVTSTSVSANLTDYVELAGGASGVTNGVYVRAGGSTTNNALYIQSKGTSSISFFTNWVTSAAEQLRVSHTASAVNYVQVTGGATGNRPTISAQGSDTNIGVNFQTKGSGQHVFYTNAGSAISFVTGNGGANYAQINGAAAGSSPALLISGSDTNIDLSLTPKGTGLVRFGTYVAGALTATGYINIKAADGTTYKVLVST